jgi:uncharacterized membrane protein YcfT
MKLNWLKIIKGLAFIGVAILFLFVMFYNIVNEITVELASGEEVIIGMGAHGWYYYVERYFVEKIYNYIFSGLFFLIGIIEIKEGIKNGI